MIRNRGKLKTIIALAMCTSIFTSVNVFALEREEKNKEISAEYFQDVLANVQTDENTNIFTDKYGLQFNKETKTITGYNGTGTDVQINYELDGVKVLNIGERVFQDKTELETVDIKYGVTSIGEYAFFGCKGLKEVKVPDSVTSMGDKTFEYCENAKFYVQSERVKNLLLNSCVQESQIVLNGQEASAQSNSNYDFDKAAGRIIKYKGSDAIVVVPSEINGIKVKDIGGEAFAFKSKVTSVEIPEGITSLSATAFFRCGNLTKVIVPDSLESISGGSMYGCPLAVFYVNSEKVKNILLAAGVDKDKIRLNGQALPLGIEDYYTFDASIGKIGNYKGTDKEVIIPSEIKGVKVKSLGVASFKGCSNITSIRIPYGVESIGEGAFYECTSLKDIVIPNSVTQIGPNIFYGCTSLKSVTIPESVTTIARTIQKEEVETFYVESERVKQLLISSGRDKSKIILKDKSGKDAGSSQTNGNTNTTTTNQTNANNSSNNTNTNNNKPAIPTVDTLQWIKNSDGTWKLVKGTLAQKGWQKYGSSWYLMDFNGIMLTGWQKYDGKWYLMSYNGDMLIGWQKVNGRWYYLYGDGHMASNTVIDGYRVNYDGAWIY